MGIANVTKVTTSMSIYHVTAPDKKAQIGKVHDNAITYMIQLDRVQHASGTPGLRCGYVYFVAC